MAEGMLVTKLLSKTRQDGVILLQMDVTKLQGVHFVEELKRRRCGGEADVTIQNKNKHKPGQLPKLASLQEPYDKPY